MKIRLHLKSLRGVVVSLLLLVALQQFGSAALIAAKAQLAPLLIGNAWSKTLISNGAPQKPWPWADTWPVARLEVPKYKVDLYVLYGAAGNSLAFGPGYEAASAPLGQSGTAVIGGHRDTHFQFLQHLQLNTLFSLQLATGERKNYQVSDIHIVDTNAQPMLIPSGHSAELLLVTCYPFDALLPGGPLRYVVTAREVAADTVAGLNSFQSLGIGL